MAKQNVTFIERHVEKIVVGVAGAVFLAMVVLYGIDTPNKAEVSGEPLTPEKFYARLKNDAEQALGRMRSATAELDSSTPELPPTRGDLSPYTDGLKPAFPVAFAPLNPVVPDVGDPTRGNIVLAEVLPPSKPVLGQGRAQARLPRPVIVDAAGGDVGNNANLPMPITSDHSWVVLTAAINREAQRLAYEQAEYDVGRRALIVTRVQAERQMLQPDGRWGEPVVVESYAPTIRRVVERVPVLIEEGRPFVREEDKTYITRVKDEFYSFDDQDEVLRPPFQALLNVPVLWEPAKTLEAFDSTVKLAEYNVVFYEEGGIQAPAAAVRRPPAGRNPRPPLGGGLPRRFEAAPAAPRPGAAPPAGGINLAAQKQATALLGSAKEEIAKKNYIEADDMLAQVADDPYAKSSDQEEARKLRAEILTQVEIALNEADQRARVREAVGLVDLGEDVQPLWLTDLDIEPGRTYRYRARLLTLNQYAGAPTLLKDPQDAGLLVRAGRWSEWSDPITVRPSTYLFFTEAKPETKTARVEIWQFADGKWEEARGELTLGDPASVSRGRKEYRYDGVVADLQTGRQYRLRTVDRSGKISYEEKSSDVLVLVNSSGEVQERYQLADMAEMREVRDYKKQYDKIVKDWALNPAGPQINPGRPMNPQRGRPEPARPAPPHRGGGGGGPIRS
jgi:hypothetical protein